MDWMSFLLGAITAMIFVNVHLFALLPWLRRRRLRRDTPEEVDFTLHHILDRLEALEAQSLPPLSPATTPTEDAQSGERGS